MTTYAICTQPHVHCIIVHNTALSVSIAVLADVACTHCPDVLLEVYVHVTKQGANSAGMALLFYSLNLDGSSDSASLHTGCPILQGVKWTATKWIHTKPFRPEWLVQAPEVWCSPHFSCSCNLIVHSSTEKVCELTIHMHGYLPVTCQLCAVHATGMHTCCHAILLTELMSCYTVPVAQVFQDPEECEDLHKLCSSWAKSGECKSNVKYMEGDDTNLGMCRRSCDVCTVCAANDLACRSENRIRAGYLPVLDM